MYFLTDIIGLPLPTSKPVRPGDGTAILTERGFVVCDPSNFGLPDLYLEATSLPSGSGYLNGHLHLSSRNFPMYFPGSSPPMILLSRRICVLPFQEVPADTQALFLRYLAQSVEIPRPAPELLRNVLPWFEVFEERASLVTA